MDHHLRPHRLNLVRALSAAAIAAGTLSVGGLGTVAVPQANAHDAVVGGTPSDGQVLDAFPESITLDFSSYPKEGFNTMAVTNQDGEVLFSGEPTLNGTQLTLAVPSDVEAGDGQYTVGFQITSSDGHATRGKVSFAVEGSGVGNAASATATPASSESSSAAESSSATPSAGATTQAENDSATESKQDSGSNASTWGVLAALLVVIVAAIVGVGLYKRNKVGK